MTRSTLRGLAIQIVICVYMLATSGWVTAAAQTDRPTPPPLVTGREEVFAGLAIAATIAIAPLDHSIDGELQEPGLHQSKTLKATASDLAFLGGPGPFVIGSGFYLVGRLTRSEPVTDVGVHLTESVLLAATITGLGKGIFGCALPGVKGETGCEFGRGFHHDNGPYVSFPSGHTAAGFAMASALTSETDWWHPGLARYVGVVAYTTAGCVGLARLYQNVHWASDLPLGALIGTWSGLTVVARAHARHDSREESRAERVIEATTLLAATPSGMELGWSVPFGR